MEDYSFSVNLITHFLCSIDFPPGITYKISLGVWGGRHSLKLVPVFFHVFVEIWITEWIIMIFSQHAIS